MSTSAGRVLSGLTRAAVSRGVFIRNVTSTERLLCVRSITLSTRRSARSTDDNEATGEPMKFSTSKASHRSWKVERSMGSQYQRPWWKVLPFSVFAFGVLVWCAFREESDIDTKLEEHLYKHLPGLLSDEEEQSQTSE